MITGFDIETADAELLFLGGHHGSFVRLVGWVVDDGDPQISTDPSELIEILKDRKSVV